MPGCNVRDMPTGAPENMESKTSREVMSNTHENVMVEKYEWHQIDWKSVDRAVQRLQTRIYKASKNDDVKTVHRLQKLLLKSKAAKLLAVRKVTQDNRGKKTPGVDGVASLNLKERMELAKGLTLNGKSRPVRQVMIPKPGKKEERPLGIPTMEDRAKQALAKLALEPEWEAKFEPNSYGFRPGRSAKDAIAAIYSDINKMAYYVLDADIEKCFDRIDHDKLIGKINTFPQLKYQIRAWLKAGVIGKEGFLNTPSGTPQGGVISPLLANIALHGMGEFIAQRFPTRYSNLTLAEKYGCKANTTLTAPILHRYADDFIILHKSRVMVEECKVAIAEWLQDIGLNLKDTKTRIAHTLGGEDCQTGLNYLGFNIRQYKVNDDNSATNRAGEKLGFKTLIKPSKDAIKRHVKDMKDTIRHLRNAPQFKLIKVLNSKIRGWTNYYNSVVSSRTFGTIDNIMFHQLQRWGKFRSPMQGGKHVTALYWWKDKTGQWVFKTPDGKWELLTHKATKIQRVVRLKGKKSPYDGDWVYWGKRLASYRATRKNVSKLLKSQKGKCNECHHHFTMDDVIEVDHITPTHVGGKDVLSNKQLLHGHCHDTKTRRDTRIYKHRRCITQPATMSRRSRMTGNCHVRF